MRSHALLPLVALPLVLFGCGGDVGAGGGGDDTGADSTNFDGGVDTGIDSTRADSTRDSATEDGPAIDTATTDSGARDTSVAETGLVDSAFDVDADAHDTADATDTRPATDSGSCPSLHAGDECDMVTQTGCAATQTCGYDTLVGHSKCVSDPIGTGKKGDPCDTTTLCDRGLFCFLGRCSPACCPGDDAVCGPSGAASGTCNLNITQASDGGDVVVYDVCTYSTGCHPFEYDCPTNQDCLFDTAPDSFGCEAPSTPSAYSATPGTTCTFSNDCGESQACFTTDGGKTFKCLLFCWLTPPDGFTPGSDAKGRFAANGTCTVGGTSYGTCTDASSAGVGGGLGLCL